MTTDTNSFGTSVTASPRTDSSSSIVPITTHHNIPITLTTSNYPSWRTLVRATLNGLGLIGHITGDTPQPSSDTDHDGSMTWFRQDQLILAALIGSVSSDILPLLSSAQTSAAVWDTLTRAFASTSRAHVMQLKTSLTKASIGSRSVTEYVNYIKTLTDELSFIDAPIKDDDLTLYVVNGLGPAYRDLVSAVRTRETPFRFEELRDRLIEHELFLKQSDSESSQLVATANLAQNASSASQPRHQNTRTGQGRGFQQFSGRGGGRHRGRGGGRGGSHYNNGNSYNRQSPVICQLCGFPGHTALTCRRPPPPSAHLAQSPGHSGYPYPSNNWLVDTGASHNITNDLSNLSIHSEYGGTDEIQTANGTGSQHGGATDQRGFP